MLVEEKLLLSYGAEYLSYEKGDIIFTQNSSPQFFFQIKSGSAKLFTKVNDKKEFVYSYLIEGDPIGYLYLQSLKPYIFNAEASEPLTLLRLRRTALSRLLLDNPECNSDLLNFSADELYYCNLMMYAMSSKNPRVLITTFFSYLRNKNLSHQPFEILLTRQQIASITGLRVETVIRTVKQMELEQLVRIVKGKVVIQKQSQVYDNIVTT